jgi:hypothetical protein
MRQLLERNGPAWSSGGGSHAGRRVRIGGLPLLPFKAVSSNLMSEPIEHRSELDEAEEGDGQLLVLSCDPAVAFDAGKVVFDRVAQSMNRFRNNFYLETMIPKYADNLQSLRGFKFDWSRNDPNFDHVYANQAFTHKLNEFGVTHEAEEYNRPLGADWGVDGRIYTGVLSFFERNLVFYGAKENDRN